MTWREYHASTKHSTESLRRTQHSLDWRNTPDPFRQEDTTLHLDFADGSTMQISLAGPTSSVIVRDKDGKLEYTD
jgi:hypothetical protein